MTRLFKPQSLLRTRMGWSDDSSYKAFVDACRAAKERNLVHELMDPFVLALRATTKPDLAAAVNGFHVRPFYSAAELARLWPLVCIGLAQKQQGRAPSAAKLAERLIHFGLPRIKQWGGSYEFKHYGKPTEFFIVQDLWRIMNQRFTQNDFDRIMSGGKMEISE